MRYTRFELIVLLVGGVAILGSMLYSVSAGTVDYTELVAQALLFCVLFAAVRLGRRGGSIAAMVASVAYALLVIADAHWSTDAPAHVGTLVLRLLSFGLVGIVGGELCTRFRYGLTKLGEGSALDDWSRVFNQQYIERTISQARARHERYGDAVSVVLLSVSPSVFADLKPARQRALVRSVAAIVRADVRMVDEVARIADGRFVVLMPNTDAAGGTVVRDRLTANVARALGCRAEAITTRLMSLPGDREALDDLLDSLAPAENMETLNQSVSGAYSSSAAITRNPASVSAVSAPAASTLNTSTAASPDGSTKQ